MQVKSPEISRMLEAIENHFKNNISNRFTRAALSLLALDNASWNQIEQFTEKGDSYRYQGYHLEELYGFVLAMARFVSAARKQGAHVFKHVGLDRISSQDKVLRDMVVNNYASNLNILADYVNKLYMLTLEVDKEQSRGKKPVSSSFPELNELGRYLVG